jgi:hypothetical protein
MEATEKCCSDCGKFKPRAEFWKHRGKKDGLQSNCKACNGAKRRVVSPKERKGRNPNAGMIAAEGFVRVKVKCWNVAEGCKNERDFYLEEETDFIPRYVCDTCQDVGYDRKGSIWTSVRVQGSVSPGPLSSPAVVYRPGDVGFDEMAATVTPLPEEYKTGTRGSYF